MASAEYIVSDNPAPSTYSTLDMSTAVFASLIASTFFLWIVIFMSIADLRMWFYTQSNKLREINEMMLVLEASTIQCGASQLAIIKYKSIREQDIVESERLKTIASTILPSSLIIKGKVQPIQEENMKEGRISAERKNNSAGNIFGMHAAETRGGEVTSDSAIKTSFNNRTKT
jgi:hypothetical protein